jgi:hypothetical protein
MSVCSEPDSSTEIPTKLRNMVMVDSGALSMVLNALRRDAEEGKTVRGEMADALESTMVRID